MKECMQDMLFQKKVLEDELEQVKLHNEALLLDAQDAGRDKKRRWQEARITSKYLASSLNSCVYKPCMFARVSEVNPPPPPRPPAAGSSEVNPPPPPVGGPSRGGLARHCGFLAASPWWLEAQSGGHGWSSFANIVACMACIHVM